VRGGLTFDNKYAILDADRENAMGNSKKYAIETGPGKSVSNHSHRFPSLLVASLLLPAFFFYIKVRSMKKLLKIFAPAYTTISRWWFRFLFKRNLHCCKVEECFPLPNHRYMCGKCGTIYDISAAYNKFRGNE
jgi:hypothetical protein